MVTENTKEKVERGINRLNNYDPNWFEHIDLDHFDMSDCSRCVIGHVLGHFFNYDDIMNNTEHVEYFGFESDLADSYSDLEEVWRNRISELKN